MGPFQLDRILRHAVKLQSLPDLLRNGPREALRKVISKSMNVVKRGIATAVQDERARELAFRVVMNICRKRTAAAAAATGGAYLLADRTQLQIASDNYDNNNTNTNLADHPS